jgi:hypothetical protein
MTNKILTNMTQHLTLLKFLSIFSLWLIPALLGAREPQIQVQQILQTTQSWDGASYQSYPIGQPQLTVLRIKVPPNTALHWCHPPVISVGYVLWLDEMNRRGVTLFVHPVAAKASRSVDLGIDVSLLEFMFDTTRMLTNMIFSGAKNRFSKIKIISTHGGGTIPYLMTRIETLEKVFGPGKDRAHLSPEISNLRDQAKAERSSG